MCCGKRSSAAAPPTEGQAEHHAQSDLQGTTVVDISAFTLSDTGKERDRALNEREMAVQGGVQEISIELEVDGGIEIRK